MKSAEVVPKRTFWRSKPYRGKRELGGSHTPAQTTTPVTTINIPACGVCVLFRSRRGGKDVAGARQCCFEEYRENTYWRMLGYTLDSRKWDVEGSGFIRYREEIKRQLDINHEFFRDRFIDVLRTPAAVGVDGRLSHDDFYLRILIEIAAKGVQIPGERKLEEGVNVSVKTPPLYVDEETRGFGGKKFQVTHINRWKGKLEGRHPDYAGIGIAVDVEVYYHPDEKICFEVGMGLPVLKESLEELECRGSLWDSAIIKALSDNR